MKEYIAFALCLMIASVASAANLVTIPLPAQLASVGQAGTRACVGLSFNADGSIHAECRTEQAYPCSGRSCTPVYYITDYLVDWGDSGEIVTTCSVTKHHVPQADVVTYASGYNSTTCPSLVFDTGTEITLNGSQFYYVTTDSATGRMLVNSPSWGYLYTP